MRDHCELYFTLKNVHDMLLPEWFHQDVHWYIQG